MKTILLHIPDLDNNRVFVPNSFHFNDPFIYLREKLFSLGYDLKTSDNYSLSDCDHVIFFNAPVSELIPRRGIKNKLKKAKSFFRRQTEKEKTRDLYKECADSGFKNFSLILWESKSIIPENFDKKTHEKFPVIFTWNKNLVDNKKFFRFFHPIARQLPAVPAIPFKKKKLLINISRNRYSNEPNELYSARRESIRYFEKKIPDGFDLYGFGWNKPVGRLQKTLPALLVHHYRSYRGSVEEKAKIMPCYKFALCYENHVGDNGWVTEKIFDAMRLGTVPIYWGAANVAELVHPDAFVDRRQFKTNKELAEFIDNMSEAEYNKYIEAINIYLKSGEYSLFSAENFADIIIKTLKLQN
jgi:hypothetical protein